MGTSALLLGLLAGWPDSIDRLIGRWGGEDLPAREEASAEILERWREWGEAELALLEAATGDPDGEVAARARRAHAVIVVRRRLAGTELEKIARHDEIVLAGSDEERLGLLAANGVTPLVKDRELLLELALEFGWSFRPEFMDRLAQNGAAARLILPFLEHADPSVRAAAVGQVIRVMSREGLDRILPLLGDGDAGVRSSVLYSIQSLQLEACPAEVVPMLDDPCGAVRARAAGLLVSGKVRVSAEEFVRRMPDPDPAARAAFLMAIGCVGEDGHAAVVARFLEDEDREVRRQAVFSMSWLRGAEGASAVLPLLQDPENRVREAAICAIQETDASGLAGALLPILRDPDESLACMALEALARLAPELFRPMVQMLLDTPDSERRRSLAGVIGERGGPACAADLEGLLYDPDIQVRRLAFEGMRRLGCEGHLQAILSLLWDTDSELRRAAASHLVSRGDQEEFAPYAEALYSLLRDPDSAMKATALEAMGRLLPAGRVPELIALLSSDDEELAMGASGVLQHLARPADAPLLRPLLYGEDERRVEWGRQILYFILERHGPATLGGMLGWNLGTEELWVWDACTAETADEAGDALVRLLSHPEAEMRQKAARALGEVGAPRHAWALLPLLQEGGLVAESALRALVDLLGLW